MLESRYKFTPVSKDAEAGKPTVQKKTINNTERIIGLTCL